MGLSRRRESLTKTLLKDRFSAPTLFNIYLRKLKDHIHSQIKILQFADLFHIFGYTLCSPIENSLNCITEHLQDGGFEVPSKTQWFSLNKCSSSSLLPPLQVAYSIGYTYALLRPNHHFLSIILDSGFTSRTHLESTAIKAKKILQVLSAIRNTWWSAHPQLFLGAYRSMLRASSEYSSLVFGLSRSRTFL